ncbi:hypothetical protein [Novosphingobium sp. B 225]|uniref:hypothetical protein n=1 Tax=Novosphingobium sp. B 225 TaxID=1961849 RepID=UPI000B4AC513|nr:hypothetical protein [Novosphingobium sp. B 225]
MKTLSKALAKGTLATVAAGAMAASSATPALADSYRGHDRDGISAGEVIAGALVIGGIAAVAASASNNDRSDYRYGRAGYGDYGRGYDRGYGYGNYARSNPRQAVQQCIFAAERSAGRYSYGRADVTDIRDVRETRYGFEVRGRIAVNSMGRGWRHGDGNYGRGWGGDYRGWNAGMRGYDSGSFKCRIEQGRIVDMDFDGVRGL